MSATAIDLSAIRTDATSYGATFRTLVGVYSSAQVDTLLSAYATASALSSGLAGKQDTLVSGTNIKTVNSTSLLGSGDITVGAAWGGITGTLSSQTDLQNALNAKANLSGAAFTGASSVSYSNTGTTLGGTGLPAQGLAIINSAGGTSRPFGLLLGGTTNTHFAGLFGLQVTDANNRQGDVVIATRRVSTDSTLTETIRLAWDGFVQIGNPGLSNCLAANTRGSASSSNLATSGTLSITGEGSAAANAGAGINLFGPFSGSVWTSAGGMRAAKANATDGNFAFDLAWHCRQNGGNSIERMRLFSDGSLRIDAGFRTGVYTVATLPSASAWAGYEAQVTDSSVTTFRSNVAGGGANRVKVLSDGTNWLVI